MLRRRGKEHTMHGAVAGLPIASGHTSVSEGSHAVWNSASVSVMFFTCRGGWGWGVGGWGVGFRV